MTQLSSLRLIVPLLVVLGASPQSSSFAMPPWLGVAPPNAALGLGQIPEADGLEEVESLLRLPSFAAIPAQTLSILQTLPATTSQLLLSSLHHTSSLLLARKQQLDQAPAS